jgi:hypothetical protein
MGGGCVVFEDRSEAIGAHSHKSNTFAKTDNFAMVKNTYANAKTAKLAKLSGFWYIVRSFSHKYPYIDTFAKTDTAKRDFSSRI